KPPFSYPVLIRLAILGSPQKRLLLSQIYSAIEEKFPWYKESAPKAWKASVRHCLSLNKEFVRMQRAVEDPGVGCGGWWSVDEGTKGLKRPRKRRPAQSRRGDDMGGENGPSDYPESVPPDHTLEYSPAPSSQRRYSPRSPVSMSRPLSSFPSVSPISRVPPEDRDEGMDYSLRLPPIFVSDKPPSVDARVATSVSIVPEPLPPASRHQWRTPHGHQREHSHTPTASTSSSYSTNSHSGFSDRSEESGSLGSSGHIGSTIGGGKRSNPMNISSLLNDQLRTPKEEGDPLTEVEMKHEVQKEEDGDVSMMLDGMTPFSSEQTIRPASSRRDSPPPTIFALASTDRRPYSSGSSYAREDTSRLHTNTSYVRSSTPDARSATARGQGRSPLYSSSSKSKKTSPKEKVILTQNLSKVWGSSADLTRLDVEPESE
ncbi:forkhead box protein, partial [Serendipita sp. 399]